MIEQILAFVLGVSIVPFIWGILVMFKTTRNLKSVQQELPNIYERVGIIEETLNHRIDKESNITNTLHTESIKYIDSRVDKLDSRIELKLEDILDFHKDNGLQLSELRQRINNTIELLNDITFCHSNDITVPTIKK